MSIRNEKADELYKEWGNVMFQSKWLGTRAVKNPCDAWIYHEIIFDNKPDIIIETGTYMSGGTQFLASMLDLVSNGKVLTVENEKNNLEHWVSHPRIDYHLGSSVDEKIFEEIKNKIPKDAKVMVILDSDHHKDHVAKELALYAPLVTKGQYLIVEDTWWMPDHEAYQAVLEFLNGNHQFVIDKSCERYLITNNPNGFLKYE